jgi:hypothetical protein
LKQRRRARERAPLSDYNFSSWPGLRLGESDVELYGFQGKNKFAANAAPFSVRLRTLPQALEHSVDYADGSRKPGVSQARINLPALCLSARS